MMQEWRWRERMCERKCYLLEEEYIISDVRFVFFKVLVIIMMISEVRMKHMTE